MKKTEAYQYKIRIVIIGESRIHKRKIQNFITFRFKTFKH